MNMLFTILEVMGIIFTIILIGGAVYFISRGKFLKLFYHDIMEWHIPSNEPSEFDGCNIQAKCKICGKSIMQDSQGNWF